MDGSRLSQIGDSAESVWPLKIHYHQEECNDDVGMTHFNWDNNGSVWLMAEAAAAVAIYGGKNH